ncbi:MAG TPA: hypothetical protein VMT52_03400 [Planctomycetota bacterium]|nr:hypothetical protein [Planctomycetota bacterium]
MHVKPTQTTVWRRFRGCILPDKAIYWVTTSPKQEISTQIFSGSRPNSPWDHPAALASLVLGILALEYVLRKRRDLV